MKIFKNTKNKKGFTLVEVIISIAALGIICAVLLRLFVLSKDTNNAAGAAQEAELFASTTVESLVCADTLHEGFEALGIDFDESITQYRYTDGEYTAVIDIKDEAADYPGTLYDISVTVTEDGNQLSGISTKKYEQEAAYE
jgi:prepilin-type N-terminal cleavage/methylation domain-containing protein